MFKITRRRFGHYPCENLFQCGVGNKEGLCKKTGKWCFRSDQVVDCPYRKDRF